MPQRLLAPDLILINGHVRTMDAHGLVATAVAIKDGRFVAVGSNDEIRALAGPATRLDDLAGATVIPGIIDAHNHLLSTGQTLSQVALYDCRSIPEVLDRVAARAALTPPGRWITGRGWDESLLAEERHPSRAELDGAAPDNPVVLHRVWNKLVANSAALRLARITRASPDPSPDVPYAGSFDRNQDGEPTGLFRDRAKALITGQIPPPSEDELVEAIATACAAYNAAGITAVAEPGLYPHQIRAFHRASGEGSLTVRTEMLLAGWGFGPAAEEAELTERFAAIGVMGGFGDDLLRLGGVKLMPDGGISDRTARMSQPYLDEPANFGTWIITPERLTHLIRWIHDLGWAIDTHTCGDEAQAVTVRAYVAAQIASPKPHLRHRVHHAYLPDPNTIRLMAEHAIPALVSAPFLATLGEGFVNAIGPERAAMVMPMRSYLDAGVGLASTSDAPITDYNPWIGMRAAANRETVEGRLLGPEEAITPAEALRSYTLGGAEALGRASTLGSITPGKLADLVVLDADPFDVDPTTMGTIRPLATLLGGRWVFDRR